MSFWKQILAAFLTLQMLGSPNVAAQLKMEGVLNALNEQQKKAVEAYITKHQVTSGELRVQARRDWISVRTSKILEDLFPNVLFVVIPWSYQVTPEAKGKYAIPGGLSDTLALNDQGAVECVFYSSGNREQFAEFLKARRIAVKNDSDAAKVSSALAALYDGGATANSRHGPSEWYLNYQESPFRAISGYEEVREAYYFHLHTDADGFVTGGRLEVETLERRPIEQNQPSK